MKIKLDENFDARLVPLLAAEGHEVDAVRGEGLSGSDDHRIYATCLATGRVLITLDLDFANPFRFGPVRRAPKALLSSALRGRCCRRSARHC